MEKGFRKNGNEKLPGTAKENGNRLFRREDRYSAGYISSGYT